MLRSSPLQICLLSTHGHQPRLVFKSMEVVSHGWYVVLVGKHNLLLPFSKAAHEQRRIQRVRSLSKPVSTVRLPLRSKFPGRNPKATTFRTHVAQSDEVFLEHERYSHHRQQDRPREGVDAVFYSSSRTARSRGSSSSGGRGGDGGTR